MRKNERELLEEERRKKLGYTIVKGPMELLALLVDGDRAPNDRQVNPTQLKYIQETTFLKAYMGPAGCAKSTTGVADIVTRALFLPGSKWAIGRRDFNDLKDTTYLTFTRIMGRLPPNTILDRSKEPPMKVWLRPIMAGPDAQAPSEITFIGLNDDLGSYEFNGAFVDELNEVDRAFWDQLKGRIRYKPTPDYDGALNCIGGAFNPPSKTHWLYTACTGMNAQDEAVETPSIKLFVPDPRENQRNLPKDYYDNMDSMALEERMRLRDGQWGSVFPGEPVFAKSFNFELHVRKCKYGGGSLYRFLDFGFRRPFCAWANLKRNGALEIFRTRLGHNQTVQQFASEVKGTTNEICPGLDQERIHDIGDPAVAQKKDTGQALQQFAEAGMNIKFRHTPFDISLKALRQRLSLIIEGVPAIIIDPSCVELIDALKGGYRFKNDGETPFKDGFFDHPVDGVRYGVFFLFGASAQTVQAGSEAAAALPSNLSIYGQRNQ